MFADRHQRWLLAILLVIVIIEVAATYAFRFLGWHGTISAMLVVAALAVAAVLLAAVGVLLGRWHRNRWQIRLSSLLLVVVAVSLLMRTAHTYFYVVPPERLNVVQLHRLGAHVLGASSKPFLEKDDWSTRWRADWVDGPRDDEVVEVIFFADEVLLAGTVYVHRMPSIRQMSLVGPRITDRGLASINELEKRSADLMLSLLNTGITDAGLGELQDAPGVSGLFVSGGNVTARGLAQLASASELRTLFLFEGGKNLRRDRIVGDEFGVLSEMTQLDTLKIFGFNLTDEDLPHLFPLPNLRTLLLIDTQVTEAGAARLRRALPECEVLVAQSRPVSP